MGIEALGSLRIAANFFETALRSSKALSTQPKQLFSVTHAFLPKMGGHRIELLYFASSSLMSSTDSLPGSHPSDAFTTIQLILDIDVRRKYFIS